MSPDIDLEQHGSCVVATFGTAYLTHLELEELCETLADKMRYDNARNFILDLNKVEFLSSACLGVLVTFLQEVEHNRGRIVLVNCKPEVAFVFKVTRLDTVFAIYDDVDDARDELKAA